MCYLSASLVPQLAINLDIELLLLLLLQRQMQRQWPTGIYKCDFLDQTLLTINNLAIYNGPLMSAVWPARRRRRSHTFSTGDCMQDCDHNHGSSRAEHAAAGGRTSGKTRNPGHVMGWMCEQIDSQAVWTGASRQVRVIIIIGIIIDIITIDRNYFNYTVSRRPSYTGQQTQGGKSERCYVVSWGWYSAFYNMSMYILLILIYDEHNKGNML